MLKIAVFVSGRGSNLKAILDATKTTLQNVEVGAVVSDKCDCPALELAKERNIPTYSVRRKSAEGYINYSELVEIFGRANIDLIVLAGFLKMIPSELVDSYPEKIINIHPALLPSFGGQGMYGMNVHKAVFDKSCQISGPTVHFVDKIYDNGKIIAQRSVDISDVESPEEIAARVLKLEHEILPYVVGKIADGKVEKRDNRIYIRK